MTMELEVEDATKKRGGLFLLALPIVAFNFGYSLAAVVLMDLVLHRTCLVSLNINSTDCSMLRTNSGSPEAADLEARIEPYASVIVMTKTLVAGILPGAITLFFGSWSDQGGRRPLLLASFSGFTLQYLILCLMSNWNISPWYLVFALIPANIVGGIAVMQLAFICHISDTTAEDRRTLQLALLQMLIFGGRMLGGFTAPSIYHSYGYTYVFGTAAACCGSALLFTYHRIPETVKDASKKSVREPFNTSTMKEIVTCSYLTKLENFQRCVAWLAIFTLTSTILIYRGQESTGFLFTRARLGWNVTHYSYYVTIRSVLRVTGLCGVLLRSRVSGVTDTILAGVGYVSALGGAITRSLAWQSWHMYLDLCIGVFNEISPSSVRSIISKSVPPPDVGKVFALVAVLEIFSTLIGAPIFTLIYSNYLPPIYPSPVHLLSSSVYGLLIICVISIEVVMRKSRKPTTYTATAQEDF